MRPPPATTVVVVDEPFVVEVVVVLLVLGGGTAPAPLSSTGVRPATSDVHSMCRLLW